jgi:septal ring factor EnvC (AmiA/AmiB activator)
VLTEAEHPRAERVLVRAGHLELDAAVLALGDDRVATELAPHCRRGSGIDEHPRRRQLLSRAGTELLRVARERRGRALVSLDAEAKNRAKELERLKDQQGGLEKLVRELRRALERIDKFPTDSKDAFAKLRGKLAWPVAGRLAASFGQVRAGGVKWDGVLVSGAQGSPVRAIYHGRVVYADWLSGLGLLTIIDHGDGYLSLYGHNERLFKEVGERVTAGDTIATLGDTGGRANPALYFEIRKGGRPIDPKPWFKTGAP